MEFIFLGRKSLDAENVLQGQCMLNIREKFDTKLFWHVRRRKFFSRYILSGFHCILLAPLL
jgi:hypothetical protein